MKRKLSPPPYEAAPVNLTAQSGENSVSAKKRLKNLLYKPIILNSEPHSAQTAAAAAAASAAPGVETKRNQRRSQNQPTRYYDQAPALNWNHAVSWGWGVWVSVSDIGRVGLGWPLYTNP